MGVSRIFWDTNLFIYLFEGSSAMSQRVVQLRERMRSRGDQLLTSALTLGEVLVKPIRSGQPDLVRAYEEAITQTTLVVPFDAKAARIFARLRSTRTVSAPDAIQLACASVAGTDVFITNDERLQRNQVEGVQFVVSLEHSPL
jgi:predicted nucleic acid-binding protein